MKKYKPPIKSLSVNEQQKKHEKNALYAKQYRARKKEKVLTVKLPMIGRKQCSDKGRRRKRVKTVVSKAHAKTRFYKAEYKRVLRKNKTLCKKLQHMHEKQKNTPTVEKPHLTPRSAAKFTLNESGISPEEAGPSIVRSLTMAFAMSEEVSFI